MLNKKDINLIKIFTISKRKFILEAFYSQSFKKFNKSDNVDLYTDIEKSLEISFSEFLRKNFSNFSVHLEDSGFEGTQDKPTFYIDVIDGTKYFAKNIPFFSVSIGLKIGEQNIFGFIYNPITDQYIYGQIGLGVFINSKKIEVLDTKNEISQSIISLEFDIKDLDSEKYLKAESSINKLFREFYRVRMLGAGAFSFWYIINDYFDAYVDLSNHYKLKPGDISGGLAIVESANLKVVQRNFLGKILTIAGKTDTVNYIDSKIYNV